MNKEIDWSRRFVPVASTKNTNPSPIRDIWWKTFKLAGILDREEVCDVSLFIAVDNGNYFVNYIIATKKETLICEKGYFNLQQQKGREDFYLFITVPLSFCRDRNLSIVWFEQNKEMSLQDFNDILQEWKKLTNQT